MTRSTTAWLMLDRSPSQRREMRLRWAAEVIPALASNQADEAMRRALAIFEEERS